MFACCSRLGRFCSPPNTHRYFHVKVSQSCCKVLLLEAGVAKLSAFVGLLLLLLTAGFAWLLPRPARPADAAASCHGAKVGRSAPVGRCRAHVGRCDEIRPFIHIDPHRSAPLDRPVSTVDRISGIQGRSKWPIWFTKFYSKSWGCTTPTAASSYAQASDQVLQWYRSSPQ